jgi:predicted permease
MNIFDTLTGDIRYAMRSLLRTPAYTAVALATLALGIGALVAMFTLVNGVLLRPLPYEAPDRLVRIYQTSEVRGVTDGAVSPIDLQDWRAQGRSFSAMAAYWSGIGTLTGQDSPTEVRVSWVTGEFFDMLGVPVVLGRPLLAEDQQGAAPVAVISERLWREQFGADPGVLGRTLHVSRETLTIVGVAPTATRLPVAGNDVWMPQSLITPDSHGPQDRSNRYLEVLARLAPGATSESAQAEMAGLAARLEATYPDSNRGWDGARVIPLRDVLVGDVDRALIVVFAAVAIVLLIGCANLANLVLARANARGREISVRSALGASRGRIVKQFATEALVLACLGGMLGIVLAVLAVDAVLLLSTDILPRSEDVRVDLGVISFAGLATALSALLFGVLPALRAVSTVPTADLRSRGTPGGARSRLRGALVIAQVTLAVVLVVGAGLMVRSFHALQSVDPGFDPARVLTVSMSLNVPADLDGPRDTTDFLLQRRKEYVERIEALPGVVAVGSIQRLPLKGAGEPFDIARLDEVSVGAQLRVDARFVSPGYFTAMGIPLQAGEVFPARQAGGPPQVLLSESAARALWPGEDPVGRPVRTHFAEVVVAGVVGDVRQLELASEPQPALYMAEYFAPRTAVELVIRTAGSPLPLVNTVRGIITETDPNQPVRSILTLEEVLSETLARDRFFTLLFAGFGTLALGLAAVGIYGMLAYAVSQRTQEIGVRIALGAHAASVVRMVLASGMALTGAGVALGLLAALALARLLSGLLYGVTPADPVTFLTVPLLLAAVALLASYLPARRATSVDPMQLLRSD